MLEYSKAAGFNNRIVSVQYMVLGAIDEKRVTPWLQWLGCTVDIESTTVYAAQKANQKFNDFQILEALQQLT